MLRVDFGIVLVCSPRSQGNLGARKPRYCVCTCAARLKYNVPSVHGDGAAIDHTRILAYAQAVAREFHPERIIFFGSYAYGTPTEDSDVDVLVVMPHDGHPAYKAAEIELKLRPGFPLDLMVRSPQRIRERLAGGDRFVREIFERGSPLYESGNAKVAW